MADQNWITVLTYNCNGLNGKIKAKRIQSALVKAKAEVVFIQETVQNPLFKTKRYDVQVQAPGTSISGGAVLISPRLQP